MLAITVGYTSPDRRATPEVIYIGQSVNDAQSAGDTPPAGIVRTEIYRNPIACRRRFFPSPVSSDQVSSVKEDTTADLPPAETLPLETENLKLETPPPKPKPK